MNKKLSALSSDKAQNVAVLTTSRSEYYQFRPILRCLQKSKMLRLQLLVSGSHLSARYGQSERDIVKDGFSPFERIPILIDDDSGLGAAFTSGLAVQMIAESLCHGATDLLLILGDRYEILAAAIAATCLNIPIAHIHGGERTDGAFDDACRHAITKLSSLHFTSTDVYRARIIQMGEYPNHVFAVGAPLVDEIISTSLLSKSEIEKRLKLRMERPIALVTYHPTTREQSDAGRVCKIMLDEIAGFCKTIIITAPNHDPGRETIIESIKTFVDLHDNTGFFDNLGGQTFISVMSRADIMIGNSSSGIHEAASFELPAVNIGSRQANRLHPRNVLDCEPDKASIKKGVSLALSDKFRRKISGLRNPYGDGHAGERIVKCLEQFVPFCNIRQKPFADGPDVRKATLKWIKKYG